TDAPLASTEAVAAEACGVAAQVTGEVHGPGADLGSHPPRYRCGRVHGTLDGHDGVRRRDGRDAGAFQVRLDVIDGLLLVAFGVREIVAGLVELPSHLVDGVLLPRLGLGGLWLGVEALVAVAVLIDEGLEGQWLEARVSAEDAALKRWVIRELQ